MTTFGSTEKDEVKRRDELPEHVKTASRVRKETATLAGLSVTVQIQEQRIKTLIERLDRSEKLFMTLKGEFEQFKQQRAIELQRMVGGGPTVRE